MLNFGICECPLQGIFELIGTRKPERLTFQEIHELREIQVSPEHGIVWRQIQIRVRFQRHKISSPNLKSSAGNGSGREMRGHDTWR
jgi:hypothetical protein